jgi:hypothetical protein
VLFEFKKNSFYENYKWIVLSILLGSIVIDLFDASKIMEFVWFWAGLSICQKAEVLDKNTLKNNLIFEKIYYKKRRNIK